jgi:DNA-binding beta-propeller fold protein YncE
VKVTEKRQKKSGGRIYLVVLALSLFFLPGCTGNSMYGSGPGFETPTGALLSLFLSLEESDVPDLHLHITSIEALAETGAWQVLPGTTRDISAAAIGRGQIFLARADLAPGQYGKIRIQVARAALGKADGSESELDLEEQSVEMVLHRPLVLNQSDSESLFITWNVDASLSDSGGVRPAMTPAPKLKHMQVDTAFVACPEISTVFRIRTDRNRVEDSFGSGRPIRYLYGEAGGGLTGSPLYGSAAGGADIMIISPSANQVVEQYHLPMNRSVTSMAVSPDGEWGYIVDGERGDVLKMEMISGKVVQQRNIGHEPVYITYLAERGRLAVSLSRSETVALLDADTLAGVGSIGTGSRPEGLLVVDDRWLYIAESGSNSVMYYDLDRNMVVGRILVGFEPRRLLQTGNSIFVANYRGNSISVLKPRQQIAARTIRLSGRPVEMAAVESGNRIYVGIEEDKTIDVVDPNAGRVEARIELGARPAGMVIVN